VRLRGALARVGAVPGERAWVDQVAGQGRGVGWMESLGFFFSYPFFLFFLLFSIIF
jgi:hypothetical protein